MKRAVVKLMALATVLTVSITVAEPAASAQPTKGRWTASHLTITPYHLGSVKVGMTVTQASGAAGVHLVTLGDGEYSSNKAPGLILSIGFSPVSCVVAFSPARVRTGSRIGFGSTLSALRKAYGDKLHFHTGAPGYSDPTSYYLHTGNRYLFFHLSQHRTGKVVEMSAGGNLQGAYC